MRAWLRPRRVALAAAAALLLPPLAFLVLDALDPFPLERLRRPASTVVRDRDGVPLRIFLAADERWRLPVTLDEVPEELRRALVVAEDARFGLHPGVDPLAVARATWTNLRAGRTVSGASTIPMQVARMVEPKPRTLGGKLHEAFRALQLARALDRDAQLEAWLNLAPFGGNVEGIGAASRFWFGKTPDALSTGEIAFLVALPRAPSRLDPSRGPGSNPQAAERARDAVLDRLVAAGALDAEEAAQARAVPLPRARKPAPFDAPHFARGAAVPGDDRTTTLDRVAQRAAEAALAGRIGALRGRGIGNGAVVVLDRATREVLAWVGSAGFEETAFDGQVDGVVARRSPGSTLKPFLYAAAFDDGRLLPGSWMLDLPTDFAGYVAENYDGVYRGRVTAREALAASLNAPAVRLLSEYGLPRFLDLLRRGGLDTLDRPAAEYGLPLILGGGEVTLLDLTNLHATLADGGVHRPVRTLRDGGGPDGAATVEREVALFSLGAAELALDVLTGVERPDLPGSWRLARDAPAVAWKTGTSYGHRDAWAVGTSGRVAVGVWVGNFDGRPVKGISGATDAGPLLFDVLRAVDVERGSGAAAPGAPMGPGGRRGEPALRAVELCAAGRERPGPFCPHRIRAEAPFAAAGLPRCAVHRRAFVDAETGQELPGDCLGARPHRAAVLERHPPELVAWWTAQGRPLPAQPAVAADCSGRVAAGAPAIVAPDPSTPYVVRRGAPREDQRVPLVARPAPRAGEDSQRLWWYQDGRLVASGAAGEKLFLALEPGVHRLVVVDGAGRSDAVVYRVEG